MPVVAASADELAAMSRDASDFQAFVLEHVAPAVLARYAFWEVIGNSPSANPRGARGIPSDVVEANHAANAAAVQFAQVVDGLNAQQLEIAHHRGGESDGVLELGIVRAGSIPNPLGLWPIVPVIVIGAALVGVWVLVHAWVSMRTLEAQSDALRAKTQAAVSDAIAHAESPQAAATLADALERANNAAGNVHPGLLDKLAGAVSDVGTGLRDSSGLLLLLAGAYFLSKRKKAA